MTYYEYGLTIIGVTGSVINRGKEVKTLPALAWSAGCNGHMHQVPPSGYELTMAHPKDLLPNISIETFLEAVNSFEGNLEYIGEFPGDPFKAHITNHNGSVLGYVLLGQDLAHEVIKGETVLGFVIKDSSKRTKLQNYFSFCLARALFSRHFQTIYLDMVKCKNETDYSWFDCWQLAQYARKGLFPDTGYNYSKGFMSGLCKIVTFDAFQRGLKGIVLNQIWSQPNNIKYSTLATLFHEGKYDELRKIVG